MTMLSAGVSSHLNIWTGWLILQNLLCN